MQFTRFLAPIVAVSLLTGCGSFRFKSLPWPTSVTVHDKEAINYLRSAPSVDSDLGNGLTYKNMSDDQRLVGLSISGGGARAAAFSLGVLAELQTLRASDGTSALDRIDFMSSNSGGGWGVATYLLERSSAFDPKNYKLAADKARLTAAFADLSKGRIQCWSQAMAKLPNGHLTFGDVYSPGKAFKLPRAYFNASLFPAQSPFVFTDKFIQHYQVSGFDNCPSDSTAPLSQLAELPITYAASASGAVPAFYYAFASTNLCSSDSPLSAASFCHSILDGGPRSYLRLADGGLYDNIGYKTAYEVMYSQRQSSFSKRSMILVNSNTSTDYKTVGSNQKKSHFLKSTALNGVFAVQDSTFERLYEPMFRTLGVSAPVLLDFYSTANFKPDQVELLDGLDALTFKAANNVNCFNGETFMTYKNKAFPAEIPKSEESYAVLAAKGGDCLSENFYRTGALGKTTYKVDPLMFSVLWELGQLSVRMNKKQILRAIE